MIRKAILIGVPVGVAVLGGMAALLAVSGIASCRSERHVRPAQDDGRTDGDLVGRLLKVIPVGWRIESAKLGIRDAQPMGRSPGPGSEIQLTHRSNREARRPDALVILWAMSRPSAWDRESPHSPVDYVGEGRLGHVYLLAANVHDNPARYWTDYRGDIAVALEAARRPSGSGAEISWGEPISGLQAGIRVNALIEKPSHQAMLVLSVRNAGSEPFRLLRLDTQKRFWCGLPIEVKVNGETLPFRGRMIEPPPPPHIREYIDLAPGAVDSTEVRMLAADRELSDLPGSVITFVYTKEQASSIVYPLDEVSGEYTEVTGLWTGVARSGTVGLDDAATTRIASSGPAVAPEASPSPAAPLRLELHPRDRTAHGLYAVARVPPADRPEALPDLFRAAGGRLAKGCAELVGCFEGPFSAGEKLHVSEFSRTENRIIAEVRYVRRVPEGRYDKSCYIHAPLPADLASGRYYVLIQLTEYLREGDKLVPAPPVEIRQQGYLTCFFDVPAKDASAPRTDWLLPGGELSLEQVMKPFSKVVVCEMLTDAFIVFEKPGTYVTQQDVKVLGLLAGAAGWPKEFALKYYWKDTPSRHETFLTKGQKAIWVVSSHASSGKVCRVGDKALPDTSENRAAVKAQYEVSRTRNFMLYGFKVAAAERDRHWPVMASVGVVNARFDEVKNIEKDISALIHKRLEGLGKEDIVTLARRLALEKEILDAVNARFKGEPVRHIHLALAIK